MSDMMRRFEEFTDEEVCMLSRHAIESSWSIASGGHYTEAQQQTHTNLMNELLYEKGLRGYKFKVVDVKADSICKNTMVEAEALKHDEEGKCFDCANNHGCPITRPTSHCKLHVKAE